MITKSYTREKLVGKTAICEEDIRNHGGEGVSKGSLVTIKNIVRGKGITIRTETCPVCGQYAYISGVDRECLTLLDGIEASFDEKGKAFLESIEDAFFENEHGCVGRATDNVEGYVLSQCKLLFHYACSTKDRADCSPNLAKEKAEHIWQILYTAGPDICDRISADTVAEVITVIQKYTGIKIG